MGKQGIPAQVAQHTPPVNQYGIQLRSNLPPGYQPYPQQQARPGAGYSANQQYDRVPVTTDDVDLLDDSRYYPQRPGSNAIMRRRSNPPVAPPAPLPEPRRIHWLTVVGLFLFTMLVGWILLTALSGWIQERRNDLIYGNPRTTQLDANFNHNNQMSHVIGVNLNGTIQVIETQTGKNPTPHMYVVATLPTSDALEPVTLTPQDLNGDGKLDLLVTIKGFTIPLYNNGTEFQQQPPTH